MLAVLWLLGCGGGPAPVETCETPECRQTEVLEAWDADPDRGLALFEALPSEVERLAATAGLIDRNPDGLRARCAKLSSGPSRDRCVRSTGRPHLRTQPKKGGWLRRQLSMLQGDRQDLRRLVVNMPPSEGKCEGAGDPVSCWMGEAVDKAREGDVSAAAAYCTVIPLGGDFLVRWRADCYFVAAEALVRAGGYRRYGDAVSMCLEASPFQPQCVKHLGQVMAREVPAADEDHAQGWVQIQATVSAIANHWERRPLADFLIEQFWADATGMSMHSAVVVSGNLLDHIPAAVVPYARSAAASRLLRDRDPSEHDLGGWVAALATALDQRTGRPPEGLRHIGFQMAKTRWPRENAEEAGMEVIRLEGDVFRVVAQEPGIDLTICVLEAAARLEPVSTQLLEQGRAHSDPRVQWTAEQLLLATR